MPGTPTPPSAAPADPTGVAALLCPACGVELTMPLRPTPDPRLLSDDRRETPAPQGHWARSVVVPWQPLLLEAFPVAVHPHDLRWDALAEPTSFGCCGYVPVEGPNLACRCGRAVGMFVDECSTGAEARFGAVWGPELPAAPAGPDPAAVRARLDRLAATPPADVRAYVTTRWDLAPGEVHERSTPRSLAFTLRMTGEGLVADLVVDDTVRPFVLAPLALARAVALRALPVGSARLALVYELLDDHNRQQVGWVMVRRGEDIELVEEIGAHLRGWRVWGEWVQDAWGAAVDRWMA